MATQLARAHITAQARVRAAVAAALAAEWDALPGIDREDAERFAAQAAAIALAAQRQAVALTEVFLAASTDRRVLGLDPAAMIGSAVRAGTAPEDVYTRPFVTVWTALKAGRPYEDALRAGGGRLDATGRADVQLSMRAALREIGEADQRIVGYRRVPDGAACDFCRLVAGQRYRTSQLMPIHNRCGCGVDVITADRREFSGNTDNDLDLPAGVSIAEHGELGPVLVDPHHHFAHLD